MNDRRRSLGLSIVLCLLCVAGCGDGLSSVSGTVTLDGQPIAGGRELRGTVTYYPANGSGVPAVGVIDEQGRYELSTASKSGVPAGSYKVAIVATRVILPTEPGGTPSGRPLTPRRYANSAESNLQAEVKPGNNTIDFALESGGGR